MVQFLSINFFLGFFQFLLGFSKVPFFCVTLYLYILFLHQKSHRISTADVMSVDGSE